MSPNRDNLAKLAKYLMRLPDNYEHFSMEWFIRGDTDTTELEVDLSEGKLDAYHKCGTVACAMGHGPAAGVPIPRRAVSRYGSGILWNEYSKESFGIQANTYLWNFLFSGSWAEYDDTPHGAAKRILYYLRTGETLRIGDTSYAS